MRSRLAWMSSPLQRPPLTAQPTRHGEAVDQVADSQVWQMSRTRASVRVVRVFRGKEILLLTGVPGGCGSLLQAKLPVLRQKPDGLCQSPVPRCIRLGG
jgi:hypothetical protein